MYTMLFYIKFYSAVGYFATHLHFHLQYLAYTLSKSINKDDMM